MKRVIKVGDRYLGLVDEQSDALLFDGGPDATADLRTATSALRMNHLIAHNNLDDDRFRTVQLTPRGSFATRALAPGINRITRTPIADTMAALHDDNRLSLDADPADCNNAAPMPEPIAD